MEWRTFTQECEKTLSPECNNIEYLLLGVSSEMGDIDGAIKKYIRGDYGIEVMQERVTSEAGDVLWYLSQLYLHTTDFTDTIRVIESAVDVMQTDITNEQLLVGSRFVWDTIVRLKDQLCTGDITLVYLYLSQFCGSINVDIAESANVVLKKLRGRAKKGAIKGDGEGIERNN